MKALAIAAVTVLLLTGCHEEPKPEIGKCVVMSDRTVCADGMPKPYK